MKKKGNKGQINIETQVSNRGSLPYINLDQKVRSNCKRRKKLNKLSNCELG